MSTENPYAPQPEPAPTPPPLPSDAPQPTGPSQGQGYLPAYSFEAAWDIGFRVFKEHYAILLATAAIVFGAGLFDSVVQAALDFLHPAARYAWSVPFGLLVSWPLAAGSMLVAARAARGGKADIKDLFLGYTRLGSVIIWVLMIYAATIVALVPGAGAVFAAHAIGGDRAAALVAIPVLLAYLIAYLCLVMRFCFVLQMFVDPELPPEEIIKTAKTSWNMTKGVWPSLLGLGIVAGILMFATILLFCVGILFVGYPIVLGVFGAAYALVVNPVARPGRNCAACGYSFKGLPAGAPCPECGAEPGMTAPQA